MAQGKGPRASALDAQFPFNPSSAHDKNYTAQTCNTFHNFLKDKIVAYAYTLWRGKNTMLVGKIFL